MATFTLNQGAFQRNLVPLLPSGFQLAAGEALVFRTSPELSGENEWVGLNGFAYPVQSGGIPAGLTQQVAEIVPAIAAVESAIAAAGSAPQGSGANLPVDILNAYDASTV